MQNWELTTSDKPLVSIASLMWGGVMGVYFVLPNRLKAITISYV